MDYPIVGWDALAIELAKGRDPLPGGSNVFTRGKSLLGRIIRIAERQDGEAATWANHVGKIHSGSQVVEALTRVVKRTLFEYEREGADVIVLEFTRQYHGYSMPGLWEDEADCVKARLDSYVGRPYGYLKIAAHAIDRWLFAGAYVARRLARMDRYPICSWVVAQTDWKCIGYEYGVHPEYAQPDCILDDQVQAGARVLFASSAEALASFESIYPREIHV